MPNAAEIIARVPTGKWNSALDVHSWTIVKAPKDTDTLFREKKLSTNNPTYSETAPNFVLQQLMQNLFESTNGTGKTLSTDFAHLCWLLFHRLQLFVGVNNKGKRFVNPETSSGMTRRFAHDNPKLASAAVSDYLE